MTKSKYTEKQQANIKKVVQQITELVKEIWDISVDGWRIQVDAFSIGKTKADTADEFIIVAVDMFSYTGKGYMSASDINYDDDFCLTEDPKIELEAFVKRSNR